MHDSNRPRDMLMQLRWALEGEAVSDVVRIRYINKFKEALMR